MQQYERALRSRVGVDSDLSLQERMKQFFDWNNPYTIQAAEDFLDMYDLEVGLQQELLRKKATQRHHDLSRLKENSISIISEKMRVNEGKNSYREAMQNFTKVFHLYEEQVPLIGSDSPEIAMWARAVRAGQTIRLMRKDFESILQFVNLE